MENVTRFPTCSVPGCYKPARKECGLLCRDEAAFRSQAYREPFPGEPDPSTPEWADWQIDHFLAEGANMGDEEAKEALEALVGMILLTGVTSDELCGHVSRFTGPMKARLDDSRRMGIPSIHDESVIPCSADSSF
jgi:hypothetical protein